MDATIVGVIITTIGVITAAFLGAFDKLFPAKEPKQYNDSLYVTFEQLTELNETINNLFNNTSADRFLLLISNHENEGYNWVSAIYEQHYNTTDPSSKKDIAISIGATGRYVKLDMDTDYKMMVEEARKSSPVRLNISTMRDSMLKNIYLYERVTYSNIYFLYDIVRRVKGKKQTTTLFCSIAKHGQNSFFPEDETYMKLIVDKIKNEIIPNGPR